MDVPHIEDSTVGQRLAPLLAALRGADAEWLRTMLPSADAASIFNSLENELFLQEGARATAIAVTSASRGEGRTTLAVMLAALAAAVSSERSVLLIDADFENGRLGQTLALPETAAGLGERLSGAAADAQCVHGTALPNLSITPASRQGGRVTAFSPRPLEEFLAWARGRYDLVIVDTPAGGPHKEVLSLAKITGHAVLVVRYGGPTREQVSNLVNELKRVGTQVMGCVMNRREYVIPAFLYGHG